MDKQDVLCMVVAVALVAVLSLVQPLLIGPALAGGQDTGSSGIVWNTGSGSAPDTPAVPTETVPPLPPTWDQTPVELGFVDPSGSTGGSDRLTPFPTIPPDTAPNRTMVTYATITGQWSGTTQTFSIPYPYWQIEYTAEPTALPPDVFPRIIIQVFDVDDPNRLVRIIDQEVYTEAPESPWVEKIYEGERTYYFRITTRFIKSYTITLQVPSTYV
jgi:hypothetical protein